jgi:D-alanyl-D-alanine-carboxypeptidase/D-alanyl-D-alanine-endopeptidase
MNVMSPITKQAKAQSPKTIVEPTKDQLQSLVETYLKTQPTGLGFAIGYASPQFSNNGGLFFAGNVQNQFGNELTLDANTPFEIASISKTFTATLYALLIRSKSSTLTLGDFIAPNGPLKISSSLAKIPLDSLVNYTSGLPQDNKNGKVDSPPHRPQPYSESGLLSYLDTAPPQISPPNQNFTYSNLAFAIMGVVLGAKGNVEPSYIDTYEGLVQEQIFQPLSMQSTFFDKASLASLPLGYRYAYSKSTPYWATAPGWPSFPAYFGAGGIVASPNDMWQWLLFNMGIITNETLSPLLPQLQTPSTTVETKHGGKLGLGWFIKDPDSSTGSAGSVWKDGGLAGFNSYIAFLPSTNPGTIASDAGAFVLVNGSGITGNQTNKGAAIAGMIANDLLYIMQGLTPPEDKSVYPVADLGRQEEPA